MCGIVGIVGAAPVAGRLMQALRRLEYRGYDSAGIATIHDGIIARRRAPGKLGNLQQKLELEPLGGAVGIGHTRWATHGVPSEGNAHPHAVGGVCIVHNGIIENHAELRQALTAEGACFETRTDSEVVAHLVASHLAAGHDPKTAMLRMLQVLRGAYAVAVMTEAAPGLIMAARSGPPLVIGHGCGEMFLGSDAIALAPFTEEITYLQDGDCALITAEGATIFDMAGHHVDRPRHISQTAGSQAEKGWHRHFMEKEIFEQPEAIGRVIARYLDTETGTSDALASGLDFKALSGLVVSACGTAYLAGSVGRYWFETYAGLPVQIDVASELRYRDLRLDHRQAALFVSQSGETADTLAALRHCKAKGARIGAIVNVPESSIARAADVVFPILAGPEIGVASTKAFTTQLVVLAGLAIAAGRARGAIDEETARLLSLHLSQLPRLMADALISLPHQIEPLATQFAKCRDVLFIGRGTNYPLAFEGALKLKEVSYIHAEGYAAGELKHGPIALIDDTMPVVVLAPFDRFFDKTVSSMEEVAARGGRIVLITDTEGAAMVDLPVMAKIVMPHVHEMVAPILFSLPLQLLAYHTALVMGTDVDQPRNLAKSVTVE